ncbi:hypothetical protein EYC80_001864 [Monilinia laxa]|uniref:Stress response RCI peptide n=1 Tax=Monilinia laxa TaxID=61186 RepID=A0A5N6K6G1_MONLA|nr:hypothetical protein EYC80_001864 [Monilinia laxa]
MCSPDIFLALIAILFPPLAVWVKRGLCTADSLINLLLCTLGFLPGLLHAWYIIAQYPDSPPTDYSRIPDAESARVTYVVVQGPNGRTHRAAPKHAQGYGTTAPMEAPIVQQQVNGTWAVAGEGEGVQAQGQGQGQGYGGEGSGGAVPPTYAEAVRGDHKVQSRD